MIAWLIKLSPLWIIEQRYQKRNLNCPRVPLKLQWSHSSGSVACVLILASPTADNTSQLILVSNVCQFSELVDLMLEDRQRVRSDKFWKMEITEPGFPVKRDDQRSRKKRLYVRKMDQWLLSRWVRKLKWGQQLNLQLRHLLKRNVQRRQWGTYLRVNRWFCCR